MSLLYATYVLLRGTFTYTAPSLATTLSLPLSAIGQISSAFPLAYGISRLLTGKLVDTMKAHHALGTGLLLAGLANIVMGTRSSVGMLMMLWGVNGLVQGVGAGASARLLTSWFSRRERGVYWALWSTSANVGAFLAPVVCALLAGWGFRAGMIVPGMVAVGLVGIVVPFMRASGREAGFGGIEEGRMEKGGEKVRWREVFVEGVLKNRVIWGLAVAYFFVYLVRSGLKSWLHFWLAESRGVSTAEAAYRASGMEVGGMAGTFSAGIVSDLMDGRRVMVTMVYLFGLLLSLAGLWFGPVGGRMWDLGIVGIMGFMINGPQMIIGLVGAEVSEKRVVATASGVLGWISYLGAAASGFPLSLVIRRFGWQGLFLSLGASTVSSLIFLAPFWSLRADAKTS